MLCAFLMLCIKYHATVDLATNCYEYACGKFPNNMELMMGLFNCYVREYSFVKQQQVQYLQNSLTWINVFTLVFYTSF